MISNNIFYIRVVETSWIGNPDDIHAQQTGDVIT